MLLNFLSQINLQVQFKIYLSTLFLSVYGKGKLGSRIGRGPTAGGEDFPCGYRQKKRAAQIGQPLVLAITVISAY